MTHKPLKIEASRVTWIEAAATEPQPVPRFSMVAYTGGLIYVAGWDDPVVFDLQGLHWDKVPIQYAHAGFAGVGHAERVWVEGSTLYAEGLISRATQAAREIVESAKRGFPWGASVAVAPLEVERLYAGQQARVNGQDITGPCYIVQRGELIEISFVEIGADANTTATVAAASAVANTSVADLISTTGVKSMTVDELRELFGGRYPDIEAKALDENWDEAKCREQIEARAREERKQQLLAAMRESRPQAPAVHTSQPQVNASRVLECAAMIAARVDTTDYTAAEVEAAQHRWRRGLGLGELLVEAARANGYTGPGYRDARAVMRYAFTPHIEAAGFSTIDIGGILSNVANKFLLDGFFSVERTWRNICATRNVSDFKTVTSYRLTGKDQYELVPPGGELQHGTLGEESFTNKADTYGLMLTIDRQDIINDDLGAITTVPRKLGAGAARKLNHVFWTTFLANSSFFTSARNNYFDGAASVLGIDSLTKAETMFAAIPDADGNPTGIEPAILLVPTALSAIGSQLFKSMELRDTNSSVKYPVANPHQGKFRVEVSRYLGSASLPGSSHSAWYLLADPNDLPVIEVAFLNGQEAPTIETADADFSVLGIQMRGYHDFGVALQDYRGGVKSKGAA